MWRPRLAQPFHRRDVFVAQIGFRDAAVHLHRAHRGDQHHSTRAPGPALRHLMFMNFSAPKVRAEARFGHNIVGQFQRRCVAIDRVTAMRDVRKRAAVHEGRVVFQRLHQVWLHRLRQQNRHRAFGLDIAA